MTRSEALAVLGATEGIGGAEVRRRFQDQYSDLQIRLTSAPTPELCKLYQSRIQQLREAAQVLSLESLSEGGEYFPTPEPILASESVQTAPPQAPASETPASMVGSAWNAQPTVDWALTLTTRLVVVFLRLWGLTSGDPALAAMMLFMLIGFLTRPIALLWALNDIGIAMRAVGVTDSVKLAVLEAVLMGWLVLKGAGKVGVDFLLRRSWNRFRADR